MARFGLLIGPGEWEKTPWIEETDPATGYIPSRFTSKELDEETGLYYYGARYYEPTSSRWMSAYPAGFGLINPMGSDGKPRAGYSIIESLNWYSYVSNNPVKYVDPTGEEGIGFFSPGATLMDYFAMVLKNSREGELVGLADSAANGDASSQAMMMALAKAVSVELLREGSDVASGIGEVMAAVTLVTAVSGVVPIAVGAAFVGFVADAAAFALSGAADIIEGDLTGATVSKGVNLVVSAMTFKTVPKFDEASKQFIHVIGSKRGQTAATSLGRLGLGGPAATSLVTGASSDAIENIVNDWLESRRQEDRQ